ncbi:Uncharacterised protein [Streptococcus anginosus]|uniref:hypothetical protein n=1 Tax=Streptococcus anginosus TaxID=1328 RepID=UPI0010CAC6F0|nr:hypothetical protein [Streptococcus anginosus]VTS47015.1 Uncharacterised protein [Streptococcus anginosus]
MSTELKYGNDYPKSCPPSNAVPIEGNFYRLCATNPPTLTDFKTHVDLGLSFPPQKICEAKALSFFTNLDSIEKMKKRFPRFKNMIAVLVSVSYAHGVSVLSDDHLNLWEYQGVNFLQKEGGVENE